ncbi:efflux RND transporter periplasmic adaptor subunit [Elusimicrobiota bacterium]
MRKLIYVLIAAVFIFLVIAKANVIKGKNKKEIVSISKEWANYGKPVSIAKIGKGTIINNTRVTGEVKRDIISVNVPLSIKFKIKKGQEFTAKKNGKPIKGSVISVSKKRDMLSGLYLVELKCSCDPKIKYGNFLAVDIQTEVLKNALKIPLAGIFKENGKNLCWTVDEKNKVTRKEIKIGTVNEHFAHVLSGVKEGDMVCVSGIEVLNENDQVRIYKGEKK